MPIPTGTGHISRLLFREDRRQASVKFRLWKAQWHDPYPEVPGTVPEKMVFAELMFRQVQFVFQAQGFPPEHPNVHLMRNLGDIRPDFLIPSVKAVLEIQGTYFHTQPDAEQHDLDKLTEYKAWHWNVYWIWDTDILLSPSHAVDLCQEATGSGPTLGMLLPKARLGTFTAPGATTADANAVAAGNRKRARPKLPGLKARVVRGRRRQRPREAPLEVIPVLRPTDSTLTLTEQRAIRASQRAMKPAKKKKGR